MADQYTNCESTIAPGEILCSQKHCVNYQETSTMKRVCKCENPNGGMVPDCKPKNDSFPVETSECYNKVTGERRNITPDACFELRDTDRNWNIRRCFCCCSCFAWGTLIAVPGEYRQVQTIAIGDPVLAGSPTRDPNGVLRLSWEPRTVAFSDGTTPGQGQVVIMIQYGDESELMVTTDQPFLTPGGALVRADRLTVEDLLVDANGNPVPITGVTLGTANVGIHNLGTADPVDGSLDRHLLLANGVVAGDHTVRLLQSSMFADAFEPGHAERAVIGTGAYAAALEGGQGALYASVRGKEARPPRNEAFVSMADALGVSAPRGAPSFVTPAQARAIAGNGEFAPPTVQVNVAEFTHLQKVFAAFFPGVHFHLVWESEDPNAWAFEAYGLRVVQISGKLLRARVIGREGLAFIMAQGVGRFLGSPPSDRRGYACTGQADYFAVGYGFINLFYGQSLEMGLQALSQVKKLFAWAEADGGGNGGGDGDGDGDDRARRCRNPGLRCRIEAINAALAGQDLPQCAGAPVPGSLRLESVAVREVDLSQMVVATFSEPVDPASVGNVVSWTIRPVSEVTSAEVDPRNPRAVLLSVVFPDPPEGRYTLAVADVLSSQGATLDPEHAGGEFDVPGS